MRISGSNFFVGLRAEDGVVVKADRPVSYMRGWPLARVLARAERCHLRVDMTDDERAQVEREPSP